MASMQPEARLSVNALANDEIPAFAAGYGVAGE